MVAAGFFHTVLLTNEGEAVTCGKNDRGQCDIPELAAGQTYTDVAAGDYHTVLLTSQGTAVACGLYQRIPELVAGQTYTDVAAGKSHTVLLTSDGMAVACGCNRLGQCNIPELVAGQTYSRVAAGEFHTVLLTSEGAAVACGGGFGQFDIPEPAAGQSYTDVAAGSRHTVLLTSEGTAVACGSNQYGQCSIPELSAGLTYTRVAAGNLRTVLLTSEGKAVAFGAIGSNRCNIPMSYTYVAPPVQELLLQALLDGDWVRFLTIGGVERCRVGAGHTSCLAGVYDQLVGDRRAGRLGFRVVRVDAVLPDGRLLSSVPAEETVASAFGFAPPACSCADAPSRRSRYLLPAGPLAFGVDAHAVRVPGGGPDVAHGAGCSQRLAALAEAWEASANELLVIFGAPPGTERGHWT